MKKILSLILLLIIAFSMAMAFSACGKNTLSDEIKVMTYNIRVLTPTTDADDKWDNRKDALVAHIKNIMPDIVGMQEVSATQREFLKENLKKDYDCIGRGREIIDSIGEGCYIFYRKNKLELIEQNHYWLSETPNKSSKGWDASNVRMVIYGKFKDKATNTEFMMFNTHFDHMGENARENGLRMVLEDIAQYNIPCILTGDFNFDESNYNYDIATEELNDTKYIAEKTMSDGTYHDYGKINSTNPIDFILVSRDNFNVLEYKIYNGKFNNVYTSDHYAIMTTMKFLNTENA